MPDLSVRQAVFADLDLVAPLFDAYRQFYDRAPDLAAAQAFLRDRFEHGQSVVFLAVEGEDPVGFTQLYPSFSSVSLRRTFILNDLFVVPDRRRAGVGGALLDAATGHARKLGAVRLSLNTDVRNTTAQATYEARGWQRDREYYAYHFTDFA